MSEDLALEALLEFLSACEAGIQAARQRIRAVKVGWDPKKIRWERAEGTKGSYQRSEDIDNPEFKIMLKDLAGHGGRLSRGAYFYWVFQNGSTVGRKQRGKTRTGVKPEGLRLEGELERAKQLFSEDMQELLEFKLADGYVKIVPRKFLGSDHLAKILEKVKSKGGKYVSAGKDSHFKIPR